MIRRRGWARRLPLAGLVLLVGAVASGGSTGSAGGSFTATADARLLAVDATTVPGVLFDQLVDAGYDVAQARLDSLGQSTAFASSPYPSESAVLLPGLVAGITAGATSGVVPDYPLIASSAHPTDPDQRVEVGPLVLDARSRATQSDATSSDGLGRSHASVSFDDASDTLTVRAETSLSSVALSEALVLHGVHAVAEVRQVGGGKLERSSTFEVAAISILGQRVALSGDGLSLLGQDLPLLDSDIPLLAPLLSALADQGTTFEVLPRVETPDGVRAAGLRIRSVTTPPPELAAGVEQVVTTVTLGGASASIAGQAFPDAAAPSLDVSAPTSVDGSVIPGSADGFPAGAISSATPGAAPGVVGPVATVPTSTSGLVPDISIAELFPLLFIAGCVLLGITNLFRHFAVRTP